MGAEQSTAAPAGSARAPNRPPPPPASAQMAREYGGSGYESAEPPPRMLIIPPEQILDAARVSGVLMGGTVLAGAVVVWHDGQAWRCTAMLNGHDEVEWNGAEAEAAAGGRPYCEMDIPLRHALLWGRPALRAAHAIELYDKEGERAEWGSLLQRSAAHDHVVLNASATIDRVVSRSPPPDGGPGEISLLAGVRNMSGGSPLVDPDDGDAPDEFGGGDDYEDDDEERGGSDASEDSAADAAPAPSPGPSADARDDSEPAVPEQAGGGGGDGEGSAAPGRTLTPARALSAILPEYGPCGGAHGDLMRLPDGGRFALLSSIGVDFVSTRTRRLFALAVASPGHAPAEADGDTELVPHTDPTSVLVRVAGTVPDEDIGVLLARRPGEGAEPGDAAAGKDYWRGAQLDMPARAMADMRSVIRSRFLGRLYPVERGATEADADGPQPMTLRLGVTMPGRDARPGVTVITYMLAVQWCALARSPMASFSL